MKRRKRENWPEVFEVSKGESMSNSKYILAGVALLALLLLIGAGIAYANVNYTQEGTVKVVTYFGRIERVYHPDDGWFTTLAPGRDSYEVNIKSFTESAP